MNKQPKKNKQQQPPAKLTKVQLQQVKSALGSGTKANRGGILSQAGGILGSVVGMSGLGKFLGQSIASILGRGDYTIKGPAVTQNSLVSGTTPPQFGNDRPDRATIISHREYLTDIQTGPTLLNGATTFNSTQYSINPGLNASFPWLANVARNYEEYEMLGCLFEFKSTSAQALNSTNTALGTVILSTQYNVLNAAFVSKLEQENYEFAQSMKPSESGLHAVECARNQNVLPRLYIRTGTPTSGDLRMYDLGNFQISTVGMQAANVNIGELWITYHIALYKPKVPPIIDTPILSGVMNSASGSATWPMGSVTKYADAGSSLNFQMVANATDNTTSIVFPTNVTTGYYLCTYGTLMAAGVANKAATFTAGVNTLISVTGTPAASNADAVISYAIIQVIGPGGYFRLTGTTGNTLTSIVLRITQWNKNLISQGSTEEEKLLITQLAQRLSRIAGRPLDVQPQTIELMPGRVLDVSHDEELDMVE